MLLDAVPIGTHPLTLPSAYLASGAFVPNYLVRNFSTASPRVGGGLSSQKIHCASDLFSSQCRQGRKPALKGRRRSLGMLLRVSNSGLWKLYANLPDRVRVLRCLPSRLQIPAPTSGSRVEHRLLCQDQAKISRPVLALLRCTPIEEQANQRQVHL